MLRLNNTTAAAVFLILITLPCHSKSAESPPAEILSTDYALEGLEFFYSTGNYLDSSIAAKSLLEKTEDESVKNKALAIKLLSDINLSYIEGTAGAFKNPSIDITPSIGRIFSMLFEQGSYDAIALLAEENEHPVIKYFRSIALYKSARFNEAEKLASQIAAENPLYPYAKILLAQIMLIKGDTRGALKHLEDIEGAGKLSEKWVEVGQGLKDKIRLRIGYLMFEGKDYEGAKKNFLKIGKDSAYFKDAVKALAWTEFEKGDYKNTISTIEELTSAHDEDSIELMLVLTYSNLKINNFREAKKIIIESLNTIDTLEEGYGKYSNPGALKKEYALRLFETNGAAFALAEYDAALNTLLNAAGATDPVGFTLAKNRYNAIKRIKALYEKKSVAIGHAKSRLGKSIAAKKNAVDEIKNRIANARELLEKLEKKTIAKIAHIVPNGAKNIIEAVVQRWEKLLNRQLTDSEKIIIEFVMLDGESGVWYLNDTAYNQLLYWMAIDSTKDVRDGSGKGILERIVDDLYAVNAGKGIPYESILPGLDATTMGKEVKRGMVRLEGLGKIEKEVEENKVLADEAEEKIIREVLEILRRRSFVMTSEIKTLKKKALKLLKEIEKKG